MDNNQVITNKITKERYHELRKKALTIRTVEKLDEVDSDTMSVAKKQEIINNYADSLNFNNKQELDIFKVNAYIYDNDAFLNMYNNQYQRNASAVAKALEVPLGVVASKMVEIELYKDYFKNGITDEMRRNEQTSPIKPTVLSAIPRIVTVNPQILDDSDTAEIEKHTEDAISKITSVIQSMPIYETKIAELKDMLDKQLEVVAERDHVIEERDRTINNQIELIAERDNKIGNQNVEIDIMMATSASQVSELEELRQIISSKDQELSKLVEQRDQLESHLNAAKDKISTLQGYSNYLETYKTGYGKIMESINSNLAQAGVVVDVNGNPV